MRKPSGLKEMLPLSPLQQGMLFHALLDDNGPDVYTVQWGIYLEGPLDSVAMRASGQALLDRHANLRSGYRYVKSGNAVAVIPHEVELPWHELDLSSPEPADQAMELAYWSAEDRERRFDLANPPLMRFTLVRLGPESHYLAITFHHILLDGWSIPLVREELFALYARGGDVSELAQATPYRDYLAWLAAQDRPAAEVAWRQALTGLEEPTLIAGADQHRPTLAPDRVANQLSEELTTALTRQARQLGVTLNTVIQAAWAIVLSRLTGRDDVVFGVTVSGRPSELTGVETIVGLFINTVPTRVQLRPWEPIGQILTRLQIEQTQLLAHHHLGLVDIQRLAGMGSLFDTLVVYENIPAAPSHLAHTANGLRITGEDLYTVTHYPLAVVALPSPSLTFELFYRSDLFDRNTAEGISGRLVRTLESIVSDPDKPIGCIDILTADERHQVLVGWNDTAHATSKNTLPELFEAQVARTPDAIAMVFEDTKLTYAELNRRTNCLAHALIAQGVGPEQIVALMLPRSVELIVALLAVQKAGSAYLPIDPDYPAKRISYMLTDAVPIVLLTTGEMASGLPPESEACRLVLGAAETDGLLAAQSDRNPIDDDRLGPLMPSHPAYVIYTSGSTGQPKGVVVPHAGIVNRLLWMQAEYRLRDDDRVLQKTPSSFDVSVWEFFWPLLVGARLVVAKPEGHKDPAYLAALIEDEQVTTAHFVPSMLQAFLQDKAAVGCEALRRVLCSGEALPVELSKRFAEMLDVPLHNLYGPTEASVDVTAWRCRPDTSSTSIPIGRPVWNTRVYVLDRSLRPAPVGVIGELYLAGVQLARGYLSHPGLTAERFTANPYSEAGERMYRTGDLVRWRPDGILDFLGRSDDQIKIRGFRIELGEIEATLAGHGAVSQVAVTIRQDQPGHKSLVAYVVASPERDADPDELRRYVAENLPDYMVPAAFVMLTELPLTPNGKLDRKALPVPDFAATLLDSRPPRDERERILCEIFSGVLGLDRVGVDDNFFTLGGDSILSISLVSRARKNGVAISPREVFEHKTVAGLAAIARSPDIGVATTPTLEPDTVGYVPLWPVVHWLCERGGPIGRFNQSMLVRIPPGAGVGRLAETLQAVFDHHDGLRLRLTHDSSVPWSLETTPPGTVRAADVLRRVDVGGLVDQSPAELPTAIAAASDAAAGRLDPEAGIMVQGVWFDAGAHQPGRLLLVVHHLAIDGVSWRILLPDLAACWEAVAAGRRPELDPIGTSLRHWAHLVTEQAQASHRQGELAHWLETLQPGAELAPGQDATGGTVGATKSMTVSLSTQDTAPLLTSVPATVHGGVNDVLLAGLQLAVLRWRQQRGHDGGSSLLVDLEGHGREDIAAGVDLSRTIGWFTSVHPARLDCGPINVNEALGDGGLAAGQALKRVKEQLRVAPDGGIGYGMLRYSNPETAAVLTQSPRPQVLFNYLGRVTAGQAVDWEMADESDAAIAAPDSNMGLPYLLEINAVTQDTPSGPQLHATWTWSPDTLTDQDINQLTDDWVAALHALTTYASTPGAGGLTPSDLTVLTLNQDEIDQLETVCPDTEDIWPLSPLQEGLYFHAVYDRGSPGGDTYVVQWVIELAGLLDSDALHAAAVRLLDRHAALRASFHELADGRLVQLIETRPELQWQIVDHCGLDTDTARERLDAVAATERVRGFDLAQSPLQRYVLVHEAADRHRLVLTSHHILADGWSVPIMIRELLALYTPHGEPAQLPTVTPYRDHLRWLALRDHDRARAAWREALSGVDEPTLLARRPVAEEEDAEAGQRAVWVALDAATTAALTSVARTRGLTLSTLVHCAWGLVLCTETGRTDVVFGSTVSGRGGDLPGIESIVGLFINTVPVRFAPHPADTLGNTCDRWQREQAALLDHQHLGLAEIHQLAAMPELFDTLLVFENYPGGALPTDPSGALSVGGIEFIEAVHYPLAVIVDPGRELSFELRHDPSRVNGAGELGARLLRVLTTLATDPETPVATLDLRSAAQRQRALEAGTGPVHPVGTETLPERIAAQAAGTPAATAVAADDATLNYAELDRLTAGLAARLRAAGTGPGAVIGVAVTRSAELIVALLGVLRSGAAYLPLDLDYPADRLELMLADSGVELVVTATTTTPDQRVPLPPGVTALPAGLAADVLPADASCPGVHPDNAAYMIYTSGSTGRPKGVVVSHRAIMNRLAWMQHEYRLTTQDRVLQKTPASFDVSVWEFFWALCEGATVVLARPDGHRDPSYLAGVVRDQRITTMHFVPSMLEAFLAAEEVTADLSWAGSLRRVFASGEALSPDTAARWRALTTVPLHNLYGPTEAAVDVTHHTCMPSDTVSVPIGLPVWNTQVHVLDPLLRPVADGVPGELYLAGVQLARCYHNRPTLTADRFVADPFGAPGERMYRTGDLVRRRPDGELEYLGRSDFQVKIRGNRIEPGEIEAALLADDAVAQATVVLREDRPADQRLVGYVVAAPGAAVDLAALRSRLATTLPGHMVPEALVLLDALPVTPNGKLNRRALPAPDRSALVAGTTPRTESEEILCGLFAAVLGMDRVGIDDDFFALGGHSLLVMRLVSRVRSVLGVQFTMRAVFDAPTVAGLAKLLNSAASAARPALVPAPRPDRLPLSFPQRRLWVLYQVEGASPTYNIPITWRISGPLDVDALRAAVEDVVERHESLRTIFPTVDGQAHQLVLHPAEVSVPYECEQVDPDTVAERLARAARYGFALDAEVPIRVTVLKTAPDEHVMLLLVHHIAADEWSEAPLTRDLATAYTARIAGRVPEWTPLPVQYADYSLWHHSMLGDERDPASLAARQIAFWREALAGLPDELALPTDRPRPAESSYRGGAVELAVPADLERGLCELARSADVSMFMVAQAAVAVLLTRLGAGTDIPLGTPIAGRTDDALEDLVGFFLNTAVLRTDTSGDPTFTELLTRVREANLAAFDRQDVPFERIVEVVNPTRSLARHPLFQVMVVYLAGASGELELPGLTITGDVTASGTAKFDLSFDFVEHAGGGIGGVLEYSVDLFDHPTAVTLVRRLMRVLAAVVDEPDQPIGRIDVLDEGEREQVLHDWADGGTPPGTAGGANTVPGLLAAQVARNAAATAVVSEGICWSFAELDARSNRLARLLAERGAAPERIVALALPRSGRVIEAILAVQKAGAAYLPLDQDYPAEHTAGVLADAAPVLLLATRTSAAGLPDTGVPLLVLDDPPTDAALAAQPEGALPDLGLRDDHPAYLIYTSGSTGRPKGVVVPHRALANLFRSHRAMLYRPAVAATGRGHLRVGHAWSFAFDASWQPQLWLLDGHSVHVLDDETRRDPELLAATVRRERLDFLEVTPSYLARMAEVGLIDGDGCPLAVVGVGGEAVPGPLWERLRDLSGTTAVNLYGPTEATVDALVARVADSTTPQVGRPVHGSQAYVLDAGLMPVPAGVSGELYLGGAGLARGYLGRPALTAERFIANPFGTPGSRLYRTGDLTRFDAEGRLSYLGRADDQVKIRGFRVEPAEIEAALTAHHAIAEAVVVARAGDGVSARLVAYVVPVPGAEPDVNELRRHVGRLLPDHMVPAAVVALDRLPVLANGKLDRRSLPAPDFSRISSGRAPSTPRERALAEVFAAVLGLAEIGIDDDFFTLGGDSIVAMTLVARAHEAGIRFTPRQVFTHRCVAELAEIATVVTGADGGPWITSASQTAT